MCESLQLHQGPGLNLMFLTAAPLSWKYDAGSDKTQYVLQPGYTLYVRGNHEAEPCGSLLKPEILKLLDIVTCGLKNGCQVQLPLTEFLQLTGRKVTEPNKDVARRQMKEHKELLRSLSMDWVENEGGYIYSNVKLFDDIDFRCGYLYACFSEKMRLWRRESRAGFQKSSLSPSVQISARSSNGEIPSSFFRRKKSGSYAIRSMREAF